MGVRKKKERAGPPRTHTHTSLGSHGCCSSVQIYGTVWCPMGTWDRGFWRNEINAFVCTECRQFFFYFFIWWLDDKCFLNSPVLLIFVVMIIFAFFLCIFRAWGLFFIRWVWKICGFLAIDLIVSNKSMAGILFIQVELFWTWPLRNAHQSGPNEPIVMPPMILFHTQHTWDWNMWLLLINFIRTGYFGLFEFVSLFF